MPIVKGGSDRLAEAFKKLIEENNGRFVLNTDVCRIIIKGGKVIRVRTSDGTEYLSQNAVICIVELSACIVMVILDKSESRY